jgi:hypothetical protein
MVFSEGLKSTMIIFHDKKKLIWLEKPSRGVYLFNLV